MILGKSVENLMGHFWVIVSNVVTADPGVFILAPDEVKELATRGGKNEELYWLRVSAYDKDEFRDAWGRIGPGDDRT